MNQTAIFQNILRQEFSCYYIEDGFEDGWESSIAELASDSAIRLYRSLNRDSLQEFLAFLEKLRSEPHHPFIETLSDETLIDWTDNPSIWKLLKEILELIGDNLVRMKTSSELENKTTYQTSKIG
jgi:hypothetical protein